MKYFVTGGTGFIGSYVVSMLLKEEHEVTVLARNPDKIAGFKNLPRLSFAQGDIHDYERFDQWLQGHDAVVHLALCWGNSALEMLRNDTQTTVALLEKAAQAGVKDFLYTSSTAGFGAFLPTMREDIKSDPIDWYCATKAASECYVLAASYVYPMRCNIIRPGYTFGVPVAEGGATGPDGFQQIVQKAQRGEDIEVTEADGTQFIFAGDLARLYRAVLQGDMNHELYHGLSRPWTSWHDIAQIALEKTGSRSRIVTKPNPKGATPDLFDLSKIKNAFGFDFDPMPHIIDLVEYWASQTQSKSRRFTT